jgi:murein DD-endopeptidase MepM/ murein hydrolase activator NlpD
MHFVTLPAGRAGRRAGSGILLFLLALLAGCSKPQTLAALFQKTTPHDDYARALDRAGLREAALSRQWQQAAALALRDSLVVTLPVQETGYFRPEQPAAASYRYAVEAGEQLHVRLVLQPGPMAAPHVFIDAFALSPGRAPELLKWASADTATAGTLDLRYRAEASGQHLLRVQAELLVAGRYTLRVWREPGLSVFPVSGRTDRAVGSFWGAARDGGARRHEGVDIFAPRGTPAVAAGPGIITRVQETAIGGRVVWLAETGTGRHLYYAHLDRQLVQAGQVVQAGDTLGLVGNTGNARTTVPHLHFGIYGGGRGAVNPWPFVRRADAVPTATLGADRRGEWVRPVRATAGLSPATPLLVLGQQASQLRVETPGGQRRYVASRAVALAKPLRRLVLPTAHEIQTQPLADAPAVAAWPARTPVAVLGEASGYTLLRGPANQQGWARL